MIRLNVFFEVKEGVDMESVHFTTLVPQIEALTKHGLKLEQFQFEK